MFYYIPFTICGVEGQLKIEDKRRYLELARTIVPQRITKAEVIISVYASKKKKFSAHIDDERSAQCSIPDLIPTYAIVTLIKGLLQMLLLDRRIYLLHGYVEGKAVHLFGTDTKLFDCEKGQLPTEKRTVYMKEEKREYVLYNDFISVGKWKNRRLERVVCHSKERIKITKFIYESFFLCLCMLHFFTADTSIKTPQYTKNRLLLVAEGLSVLVNNRHS